MEEAAASLVSDLTKEFEVCRKSGYLAGSDVLFKMARLANQICGCARGESKLLAFLLRTIFLEMAQRDDQDATTADDAAQRFVILDAPISQALQALGGKKSSVDAGRIAIMLVEASQIVT